MAGQDKGRREVVNDPLAVTGREQLPDRSLALQGVRAPNVGDPTGGLAKQANGLLTAMDGLSNAVMKVVDSKKDEAITAGKVAYMSGKTEEYIRATGDRYTQEGYLGLQAKDRVNNWFATEAIAIEEAGKKMTPEAYQKYLGERRASVLDGITDPSAKKVAVAAFEELSPRLAQSQTAKHNENNKENKVRAFESYLGSEAKVAVDSPRRTPGQPLALTPFPIARIVTASPEDREAGIRTILGEAGNQGDEGMAAVAHVIRNRVNSNGAFPTTIKDVVRQPQQFSVWNDGKTAASSVQVGSDIWNKAARVFDGVMSGRHADITGGATHFYSPEGMKLATGKDKPYWFDDEQKRAGGRPITIGGHVFAGRVGKSLSGEGKLSFARAEQDKLDPSFRGILTDTSAALGRELVIQSGHRDANHPVERAKATPGEHSTGRASDIDMTGMNDNERAALVRNLRARGVRRFGTYTNMPNTLHVDMKDQNGDNSHWFMHDRTNAKMDSAPAWFKSAASEDPRTISTAPVRSGTAIANQIRGVDLDPAQKAKSVADAIRRQFDTDDDTLFNSVGGVGFLHELKASPGDIDEVLKAKQRFEQKRANKFNGEQEAWRSDLLGRAERGGNMKEITAEIEQRVKAKTLDDSHARSLMQEAWNKNRSFTASGDGDANKANPQYLSEVGAIWQRIKTNTIDQEQAYKEVLNLSAKWKSDPKTTQALMGQAFALDQARTDSLRAEAAALVAAKAEKDNTIAVVNGALARGTGLGLVSGKRLEVTNQQGQKITVSPQEYGVQMVKDRLSKEYSDRVNEGKIDPRIATTELTRKVFLELQNHDVVDTQTQAQLSGALTGNILDPKGKLTEGAVRAYETFLTWKGSSNVNPGYLSRSIGNSYVEGLLETAYRLDDGGLSKEQALMKAHEILKDPNRDPDDKLKKDVAWKEKMSTGVKAKLTEIAGTGWFAGIFYNDRDDDVQQVLARSNVAERFVTARAEAYHMQFPNESADVSLEKAIGDLAKHSTVVAGNLLINKPGAGIARDMGVESLGPRAADDAVQAFLQEQGPRFWPRYYGNPILPVGSQLQGQSYVSGIAEALNPIQPIFGRGGMRNPPVSITYNPDMKTITIDLYKDTKAGSATLGSPQTFFVADIGAAYMKKQTAPSTASKLFNSMFENVAKPIKALRGN